MTIAWFAHFRDHNAPDQKITDEERLHVMRIVAATPGLKQGLVFTPWPPLEDLFFDDGLPPQLALELYFDDIADLERALAKDGHLQALTLDGALPSLRGATVEEQAMLARGFATPDPQFRTPEGQPHCSFIVHYPGSADDLNAWLIHYFAHHARIMVTFPQVRQVEICTRLDWCSEMPWKRVNHMQRNKVVYDDGKALQAAQTSAVLKEMRADFHRFPPFTGGNIHYPMATWAVRPFTQAAQEAM